MLLDFQLSQLQQFRRNRRAEGTIGAGFPFRSGHLRLGLGPDPLQFQLGLLGQLFLL
ncbi:MAG: hypothetical protein ACO4AJ_13630 [Prochlorothrix sp.]